MDYLFGPFRVVTAKRRLCRGDELIPLTPKAFDTLLVLVTHAGKVVEKDEILRAVWRDTFVEEATLAQNISTLRRALGDTTDTPSFIATVPRRGYRFLEQVMEVAETPAHAASESAVELRGARTAASGDVPAEDRTSERFWVLVSAGLMLGLVALGVRVWRPLIAHRRSAVFAIVPAEGTTFSTSGGLLSVAPDGGHLVFVALSPDGVERLWLRALGALAVRVLPGTEGASQPFWSPDSRFVAFFADGKLKKTGIPSGPTQTICQVPTGITPLAGTWSPRDDILFSAVLEGIFRVRPASGTVTRLVSKGSEDYYAGWPQFLPDSQHFLYVIGSTRTDRQGIYVGSLDSTEPSRITPTRSYALYSPSGHLLFVQDGTLVAQRFDPDTHALRGNAVPVAEQVAFNAGTSRGTFSVSQDGVLAYQTVTDTTLVWFDRNGKRLGAAGPAGQYLQFSISPEGRRVAAARIDLHVGTSDIWILDTVDGSERRVTFDSSWETSPRWSRDSLRIVFNAQRAGRWEIHDTSATESTASHPILRPDVSAVLEDTAPDGRVLYRQLDGTAKHDFWLIDRRRDNQPVKVASTGSGENSGRLSPDGQWLAYVDYVREPEIVVRRLTSATSDTRVSSFVRGEPRWRGDGGELFYLSRDLSMMSVELQLAPALHAGAPRRLFQTQAVAPSGAAGYAYDVTPDGRRFLVKVPASYSPITIVLDWTALLQGGGRNP